jgi:hypothetical protein
MAQASSAARKELKKSPAKIDRYRDLLQTETDATKRTIEMRLH